MSIVSDTKIIKKKLPNHVAIIMDGNGRWAEQRNLSRTKGHEAGVQSISSIVDTFLDLNIRYVSLYSFSTENWTRPKTEIKALFSLIDTYIINKLEDILSKKIRVIVSGDITPLPNKTKQLLEEAIEKTKNNKVLIINFCLNYGGQDEIIHACSQLIKKRLETNNNINSLLKKITKKEFEKHLYTSILPPVDLMVRTAGEQRLSNFLLYQNAYAELYFTDILWPDFTKEEVYKSLIAFQTRKRKFGGLLK